AGQSHRGVMSDNSSSANGNSWTILTPEVKESGIESVGLMAEAQGGQACLEQAQLKTDPKDLSQTSEYTDGLAEHNNASEAPQVAPLETSEDAVPHISHLKEPTLSATPVENLTCLTSDPEQQGSSAGHSDSEPFLGHDADSFSDSYTHISPPLHPTVLQHEEGSSEGEDKSELRKILREEPKPDIEFSEEKGNEGDGVRRRKVSLVTPVDHRDDDEEDEGEEEPYRPPQRENDTGFSLNKCIFGAVILLGLGTIFFSESDADVTELKNPELQKDWLNLQSTQNTPADVQPPEILERLAEENQKIATLQAQLQEQEGELKAAQMQVEEGAKERMRREELEVENQRMKGELDKLPALQKELEQESERVKKEGEKAKKDLEALPAMQKELELLRAQVTELAQTTDGAQALPPSASVEPSAGHEREIPTIQGRKELKDKKSPGEGEKVKEKEQKKEWKDGKERKKDKSLKEEKLRKEREGEGKELKKQKKVSQDEGKEWRGKGEGKEWKSEREEKRREKQEGGKRWQDREEYGEVEENEKRERKKNGKKWKDGQEKREIKEDGKKQRKEGGKRWKDGDENGEFKENRKREKKENGKKWKDGDENGEFKENGKREKKENGKRWKDGDENGEFKENGKREKKENGKRWKDSQEKEFKEDGKRERKDSGKRWKDGEENEFKKDGKRERKENGKRWKDSEVKKDFNEESEKMDWKVDKGKKEKNWQLDGGRWETKEKKHSGDKEWKPKDGNDEKEWKKGRQVGSSDKEWKEKNERKKDWKEKDEKERGNPRGEGKARKESVWKGEKNDHKANGGKKEWKEHEEKHWSGKQKSLKDGEGTEGWKEGKKHKGDYQKNGEKWSKKDESRQASSDHHSYSDRKHSKDHTHDDYWAEQRERIRHYHGSMEGCSGVTGCAHAEGLAPVGQRDFQGLLLTYLTKLLAPDERASKSEELNTLLGEFFSHGVFVHDQIPFSEFVEDVADILEDMAEEDEEMEDEMEGFASEAMERFALPDRGGNEERRKESGRKRASG
ncbi:hypothetical protein NFI96_030525, partial [Prochilodus magdalenae]